MFAFVEFTRNHLDSGNISVCSVYSRVLTSEISYANVFFVRVNFQVSESHQWKVSM